MQDFNTSLLREKFVIRDMTAPDDANSVIALSNRIVTPLVDLKRGESETFIVRAQNMHTAVRMAARLHHEFVAYGPLMERDEPFDWDALWDLITEGYEKKHNPACWCAVYYKGKCVFSRGEHHPFLDIVEKFDALQNDKYGEALKHAEAAFLDLGKPVKIDHETNVALVVNINPKEARCGIILRAVNQTKTFNFTARERAAKEVSVSQCLSVAAAYLEGLQLAFDVGIGKRKIHHHLLDREEERVKVFDGEKRVGRLNHAILQFDQMQAVNYRPDRPDLFKYLADAEKFADKLLKPKIMARLAAGELDQGDWVG